MKPLQLAQWLTVLAILILLVASSFTYFATDTTGHGVVAKKWIVEHGRVDQYMIQTADGQIFMLMLGKIHFYDIHVGDRVRFRVRGYPIRFGPTLLIPPQIYYVEASR